LEEEEEEEEEQQEEEEARKVRRGVFAMMWVVMSMF
jgi:hypothetical protein